MPPITSVLGEARTTKCANPGTPCRFHEGIDAAGTGFGFGAGIPVNPIEAGAVKSVGNESVIIESPTGRKFKYIHVVQPAPPALPLVKQGDAVTTNSDIGFIQNLGGQTHVHLEEVSNIQGLDFAVNPQRPGALDFVDTGAAQFVATSIGGVSGPLIPVKEFSGGEDGTNPSLTVVPQTQGGSFLGSGKVDLLVTARDGGGRKGVYSIGVTVTPIENPFDIRYNGGNNIIFDSIPDGDPFSGVKTI